MKIIRFVLIAFAICFLVIQLFRPPKNTGTADPSMDISAVVPVPPDVDAILRESCYDCHSDNTRYPWYAEVMPFGWWLNDHIEHAKSHLNFSEFTSRSLRRQYHGLEEISEQINLDEMPLPSYLIIHRDAVLSAAQKERIHRWVEDSRAAMRERYPADSLQRRRGRDGNAESAGSEPDPEK